jgi:hypothetical protein
MKTLRLGAGSGFWGDALDPAVELVERGRLDYLGLDFLAELTMALLQRQRTADPSAGWVADVVPYIEAILPAAQANHTRIICNAGGVNPPAAAEAVRGTVADLGLDGVRIATVEGDDVLDRIDEFITSGVPLTNLDTGESDLTPIRDRIVAANVYTGADGILEALNGGADIVLAGRVADSTLYVAPIMHAFGWNHDETAPDLIAAAITVGHIVECAAGATGGMSSRFDEMPRMGAVGFPIVEMREDGRAVITKVPESGGRVDEWTIKEHLAYETVDPFHYRAPDGVANFTTLRLEEEGADRVAITGMSGEPRPDQLKLVIGYEDGWIGEGMLFFPWPDAYGRAKKARETLLERFERLELKSAAIHFDFVGVDMLHGPSAPEPTTDLNEIGLRVAARTATRSEADKVRRACAQMWIMGPGGTSFGVPIKPRPVISLWPTLLPRDLIHHTVTIREPEQSTIPISRR